jgi:menaquinone-dependent protoporphyrinogen oxidase
MSTSVLVAYAKRYGSTKEVAEAIAQTLGESGLAVDLQPLRDVLCWPQIHIRSRT